MGRYSECIDLVYSRLIFSFNDPLHITWLASTTLPHRLAQITTVRLRWRFVDVNAVYPQGPCYKVAFIPPYNAKDWESACQALASMTGLQDLRIFLDAEPMAGRRDDWSSEVYAQLALITTPPTFDVYYRYPLYNTGIPLNPPFKLMLAPKTSNRL